MFTLIELLDDNMSRTQVIYALIADFIFFGSLYWGAWRAKKSENVE